MAAAADLARAEEQYRETWGRQPSSRCGAAGSCSGSRSQAIDLVKR